MKDKIEVEMLSPLMAEFIPDYSDIVDLDDAEPLEGPDLVQYQTSIAEKVDEINRLGMPDNQPCNLIDYFDQNKDIKEKVERITMAVKEQEGVLYGCANLTLRENLTPEEYRVVGQYLRGQYSDGWGESLEQREIKVDGGELYLHFYVGAGSDFQIQVKAPEKGVQEKQPEQKPSRPELKLLGHDGNIFSILGDAARLLRRAGMSEQANEMADRVHKHYSEESIRQWILQPKSRTPAGKEGISRTPKKKLKGIQALYYSYLYQMGVLKQKPKRISPVLRADIRKLDARIEQMEFLQKHQITTREELLAYRPPLEEQVQALTKERKRLYRSEPDGVRIGQINEVLKPLRKDIRICIRIEQQSREMEERMRLAEQIQRQAEQEEDKTEKTRQKETESR